MKIFTGRHVGLPAFCVVCIPCVVKMLREMLTMS